MYQPCMSGEQLSYVHNNTINLGLHLKTKWSMYMQGYMISTVYVIETNWICENLFLLSARNAHYVEQCDIKKGYFNIICMVYVVIDISLISSQLR